jgi:putative ABC transport system substrate-binding protein
MVYYLNVLKESAHAHGFEVVSVPVNSASEVADAATALASKDIDAICQIPGNLTASAFGSISQAALRERLPVFAFQSSQARDGAMLVLAQDYREAGHQGGGMAARIMLGENPRNIPLEWFSKRRVVLNADAARKVRLQLPAGLQASAEQIIGKADGNQQTAAR